MTTRIAVTSSNFRTVTGHAGKTRRFLVFEADGTTPPREVERLDLPAEQSIHEFRGGEAHPLQQVRALITGGAGGGFIRRMATWGVQVALTEEADPVTAVQAFVRGELLPVAPEAAVDHHHHDHDHGGGGHHGCGNC